MYIVKELIFVSGLKIGYFVFTLFVMLSLSACNADTLTGNVVSDTQSENSIISEINEDNDKVQIYFFWGEGCPFCNQQKEFHAELEDMYPDQIQILEFETYSNRNSVELLMDIAGAYDMSPRGVPVTFIGNEYFSGFSRETIGQEMISVIENCISENCDSPLSRIS